MRGGKSLYALFFAVFVLLCLLIVWWCVCLQADMAHKLFQSSLVAFFPAGAQMCVCVCGFVFGLHFLVFCCRPVAMGVAWLYLSHLLYRVSFLLLSVVAVICMLISSCLQVPYVRRLDDSMHLFTQCEILLVCMLGFVLYSVSNGQLDYVTDILLSTLLIAFTAVVVFGFLLAVARNLRAWLFRAMSELNKQAAQSVGVDGTYADLGKDKLAGGPGGPDITPTMAQHGRSASFMAFLTAGSSRGSHHRVRALRDRDQNDEKHFDSQKSDASDVRFDVFSVLNLVPVRFSLSFLLLVCSCVLTACVCAVLVWSSPLVNEVQPHSS